MATTISQSIPTQAEQEIQGNLRHNFLVNALDGAFYWFGYSFISPMIILPLLHQPLY